MASHTSNKRREEVAVKRAVLYLRVSSKRQMDTDADFDPEGNSINTQRKHAQQKAKELGADVVDEYVEPGNSAQTIAKRPVFRQMIKRIMEQRDVDCVIIYMRSRVFRNYIDAAITKRQLEQFGVKLVSTKENFGDGDMAEAMEAVTDVFNWLAVRQSGEDIKAKMANKARNGGTITRTPVGYLNTVEVIDDRKVRTVIVDPVRGPFIRLAFELYATGEYSVEEVAQELYDRGLRMPRNARYPEERGISTNRLYGVLRDDYYCGWITHEEEKYKGRHTPLIPQDLFDHVQMVADSRNTARERRRVHHHELKGSLFCGSCRRNRGEQRRMIVQHATNRSGNVYRYFFCNGRFDHICELPYVPIEQAEEAVDDHYATVRFTPEFIATMRAELAATVDEQQTTTKILQAQLTKQLRALDTKENNLIDLAADDSLPQGKIKAKLREITKQRDRLTARLHDVDEDLSTAAEIIEACLQLLHDPQALYRRCNDQQRRRLNQTLFEALYIDEDSNGDVQVRHKLKEPFGILLAAQSQHQAPTGPLEALPGLLSAVPGPKRQSAPPKPGTGAGLQLTGAALAGGPWKVPGSNEILMVGDTGFEPVTSSV